MPQRGNILALDVGEKRVGAAFARADVRVPVILPTLRRDEPAFWDSLADIVKEHETQKIVIGLPRGLDGQETAQTGAIQSFAKELQTYINLPIVWQDEALTSVRATEQLDDSGRTYEKGDVDGLAASYILLDYIGMERVTE